MDKKPLSVVVGIIVVVIIGILLLFFLRPKNVGEPINAPPGSQSSGGQQTGNNMPNLVQGSVDIKMVLGSIEPKRFSVKAGSKLTLNISGSGAIHVFKFEDPSLSDVFSSVGGSRASDSITFKVPSKRGEYKFFCDTPGHRARGEEGVMVVQ